MAVVPLLPNTDDTVDVNRGRPLLCSGGIFVCIQHYEDSTRERLALDKIIIKEIEFIGHCGITEEERIVGQRLSADIELSIDITPAANSDRIQDSIDYVGVCHKMVSIGSEEHCNLLETLAERMAREILSNYNVSEILIRLRKCSVPVDPIKGYFGVEIIRSRIV